MRLLTRRQVEVLQADAAGEPHKQIADRLRISLSAVDQHLMAARARVGNLSRVQAIVAAAERGLLSIPPETMASVGRKVDDTDDSDLEH